MQSLKTAHNHYSSLLRRLGRCLSFGCSPSQMQEAVSLAPAITSCWPWAFLKEEYYTSLRPAPFRRWGQGSQSAAVMGVAVTTSQALLRHVFGRDTKLEIRKEYKKLQPLRNLKTKKEYRALTCYSRLGDKVQTLDTLLPRDGSPQAWTEGKTTRFTIEVAVLSGSMTPLALVTNVVSVRCVELRRPRNRPAHQDMLTWQAHTVKGAAREVSELERRVRALELATWDREGAVEDMGGR